MTLVLHARAARAAVAATTLVAGLMTPARAAEPEAPTIGRHKVYERTVANPRPYKNKFTDVTLHVRYTSPSGRVIDFAGFYDGDGAGGQSGDTWRIRFMPDELGRWSYSYRWSDGGAGGSGRFTAVRHRAGPGVLRAYRRNPRWFAYEGTRPVFLRSYYIGAGGFLATDIDWAIRHVYTKLIARGYNHVQLNLLPIGWTEQRPADARDHLPAPLWDRSPENQNLAVWKRLEAHLRYLNERGIGVHFFMGFDPKPSPPDSFDRQRWEAMSAAQQDFYVRYVTARLAPYAAIAGWNYTWETDGGGGEAALMNLLAQHDPWQHLRTYHDEHPRENRYDETRYTFAAIENHGYFGQRGADKALDSASHYLAVVDGYRGKPVFMSEGNGLWRACWAEEQAETTITRAAWAVTLAGGSFTWQDTPDCDFTDPSSAMFRWPRRLSVDRRIGLLYRVMTEDVVFHRMSPHNELLGDCESRFDRDGPPPRAPCYALAEVGRQYLVYKENGGTFRLTLAPGRYRATWLDTRTGGRRTAKPGTAVGAGRPVLFQAPSTRTDWVLLLQPQR